LIALDTHALIWWTRSPQHLGEGAVRAISHADRLGVPAIVFWEVALLARKKKVELGTSVGEWLRETLSLPRIEPLPLTAEIAVAAEGLHMHSDPADRFIVATALQHRIALVSKDRLIAGAGLISTIW
jgi:PIN domain nuclease of toxin-antitoxin system